MDSCSGGKLLARHHLTDSEDHHFFICGAFLGGINTKEKAKVVAAVWGTELIQFLALLAILYQEDLKNRTNLSFSSNHSSAIHPILSIVLCAKYLARQGTE